MLYRDMQDNEYMNMENGDMLTPQQYPMYENPMMQYPTTPQYVPYMEYPLMDDMYNPPTYDSQMTDEQRDPAEDFELIEYFEGSEDPDAYMQRSPHSNYHDHNHDNDHDYDYDHHHDYNHNNHGYPSHGEYHGHPSYGYYNPYYPNYYPYYNFNPLLIPLLFGRD